MRWSRSRPARHHQRHNMMLTNHSGITQTLLLLATFDSAGKVKVVQ